MAVTDDDVIHYAFNKQNTNEANFIEFINHLEHKIKKKGITHYAMVMDNLSVHKTKALMDIYQEQKMNIIFNTPYLSSFNCIEFAFRTLKKKIYTRVYEDINQIIEYSSEYMESKEFKNCLKNNYKDTIQNYIIFSEKYKSFNLKFMGN